MNVKIKYEDFYEFVIDRTVYQNEWEPEDGELDIIGNVENISKKNPFYIICDENSKFNLIYKTRIESEKLDKERLKNIPFS